MISRELEQLGVSSRAVYSDCGLYRYTLSRDWGAGGRMVFVLLNPSTADEMRNDPTVERCERRARAMGFGGFEVVNLFAFRATDPRAMRHAAAPEGPDNDVALLAACEGARLILCGWGNHGAHLGRGPAVETILRNTGHALWHLGLTASGAPRHPLYVGYAQAPLPWELCSRD